MATYTVPLVSATEATLDNFNNPLRYIQAALNELQNRTALLYNKSSIIIYDQPIATQSHIGDLVYYDTTTGQFTPAVALLRAQPGAQGQSVQAACARVIGIIVAVNGATATILCGGIYKDGAVADACLGVNALAGTYYLSPDTPGKAVLDPGQNLRQPVLQYMGDGKFSLSCFYLAHDGHQHASIILNPDCWRQYQDADGVPAGSHTYDASKDPDSHMAMEALGQISPDTTALFVSGVLQTWGQIYSITDEGKLVANSEAQLTATHVLMNHYPLAYGAPVVRDVTTSDALLSVDRRGGIVQVNTVPYTHIAQSVGSGIAIQKLQSDTAIQVPVVNAINPGVGIRVSTLNGVATVTNTVQDTKYKDATLVNLNGAVHIEQGGITYIMFPEQRTVSMSIYCPIYQTYPDNYCVKFWMQYMGGGAALKATARYIPFTAHGETVAMPDIINLTQTDINGVDANMITTYESPVIAKKVVPGYLCAQISMQAASNVRVIRQGFVIDQIAVQVTE